MVERTVDRVEPTLEGIAQRAEALTALLEHVHDDAERLLARADEVLEHLERMAAFVEESRAAAAAFADSPFGKMLGRKADKARAREAE